MCSVSPLTVLYNNVNVMCSVSVNSFHYSEFSV
jgi:hypothetical protein